MKPIILTLALLTALCVSASAETKGNIDFVVYRGSPTLVLPQYASGPVSDLLWVSAQDRTNTATHLLFTVTCQDTPTEVRLVPVGPRGATTAVFERGRSTACSIAIDAVTLGERQVFAVPVVN